MAVPALTLAAGLDRVWLRLAAAVVDPASPLRTPVVVTGGAGADGRVMVLRSADCLLSTLTFYTDVRAAKVAAIAASPHIAIIAYDPSDRLQIRVRGMGTVLTADAVVGAAWDTVALPARRAYRTAAAPGSVASSSTAASILDPADGRANFALLMVTVETIEWLELAPQTHLRAHYHRTDGWAGEWRVP